jgi:hypothetical protein
MIAFILGALCGAVVAVVSPKVFRFVAAQVAKVKAARS